MFGILPTLIFLGSILVPLNFRPSYVQKVQKVQKETARSGLCFAEPVHTPLPDIWNEQPAKVRADVILGEDGVPLEVTLKNSTIKSVADDRVIEAIKLWRFEPALDASKPVKVRFDVIIELKKDSVSIIIPMLRKYRGCYHLSKID